MSAEFFLDTNILVYSFDAAAPEKRETARALIRRALAGDSGVISTQVVQEFLNVALGKFVKPITTAEAQQYLETVLTPLCAVFPSMDLYKQALELREETRFAFYDCLILAAALEAGCSVLYSEDLQAGRQVRTVRVENPFTA